MATNPVADPSTVRRAQPTSVSSGASDLLTTMAREQFLKRYDEDKQQHHDHDAFGGNHQQQR